MKTCVLISACLAAMMLAPGDGNAQNGARGGEWRYHGGDLGATKYSPLDQINKDNVSRLKIVWRRPAVDPSLPKPVNYSHNFHATPIMVDGVLYTSNGIGLIEAFNPRTGKTIWGGDSELTPRSHRQAGQRLGLWRTDEFESWPRRPRHHFHQLQRSASVR